LGEEEGAAQVLAMMTLRLKMRLLKLSCPRV
jgi:hypothetical protein